MHSKTRLPPLRAVEVFVAAGRALSFAAAAETVNLTPSAVSRRIRDLERELGTPLFRRFNRRVELTPAGAHFLQPSIAGRRRLCNRAFAPASPPQKRAVSALAGSPDIGQSPTVSPQKSSRLLRQDAVIV
jgi:Bacterial regulatory helix-turn-helix protein, lysR family